jgi:hypothetical protein
MTTSASLVMFPTVTIESVHGFKETIVLGPNGIEPRKPRPSTREESAPRPSSQSQPPERPQR